MAKDWRPPRNLEEILKDYLIPPKLYIRLLAAKARRKGERELALLPFLADQAER